MTELEIMVNGEPRRLPSPATASDLLHHLGLDPRTVVVEINRKIVRRPQLGDTSALRRRCSRAGALRGRGMIFQP